MRSHLLLVAAATTVAIPLIGCQTAYGPFAPYGPTQVPPPGTGSASRPDPYYRRSFAGDTRLSQRRFTSDDTMSGGQRGLADRRAAPGYDEGASINYGAPNYGAPNYGASTFGSAVANQPAAAEFDGPPRISSDAGLVPLRVGDNLGWRSPESVNGGYGIRTASQASPMPVYGAEYGAEYGYADGLQRTTPRPQLQYRR